MKFSKLQYSKYIFLTVRPIAKISIFTGTRINILFFTLNEFRLKFIQVITKYKINWAENRIQTESFQIIFLYITFYSFYL
jgi:hypothetical protein